MKSVFADTFYFLALLNDVGLSDALTGDHHVEQAGFKALLLT